MAAFTAAKDFLAKQHLAPLLSQVQQNLVSLNKWDSVGKALQVSKIVYRQLSCGSFFEWDPPPPYH
jgi:hypothetical protein